MARGSFHEDWNEMLERFAHRGTPAAIQDQLREAQEEQDRGRNHQLFDIHQQLFERSHRRHKSNDANETVD